MVQAALVAGVGLITLLVFGLASVASVRTTRLAELVACRKPQATSSVRAAEFIRTV